MSERSVKAKPLEQVLGLAGLGVPIDIRQAVEPLLDDRAILAVRAIGEALLAEQSEAAVLKSIELKRLDDIDAGGWTCILVIASVRSTADAGNAFWDRCLQRAADAIEASGQQAGTTEVNLVVRRLGT
jgi:hypothetical protein